MNLLDLFENTNQPQGVAEGVDVFYNAGETANKKPVGKGTTVKSKITGKVGKAYSWSVVKGVPYLHVKSDDDRYQSPAKDWLVLDEQGVSEGHADQQKTIVKRNGQPVGEVGIDRESSPGAGMYYMKHYASGLDLGGYDSREEAMDELRYAVKQGVAESKNTTEDVISTVKKKLGDYLSDLSKEIKSDPDLKDKLERDIDQIGPAVKTLKTDDGHEIKIHGNEDDGFRVSIRNKQSNTKFANLDEATMAVEMFCARRRSTAESQDYIEEA